MAYTSGGLISASDYNTLVGSNSTTAGTINYVWDVGNGAIGYGQGAVATATSGSTVAATQWSTMLNALNRCLGHQSGAGAQLGPLNFTAGQTITAFANVITANTTINTNYASYTAQGTTTTGTNFTTAWTSAATTSALNFAVTRTVTFASGDAARYFFNAGGQINLVMSGTNNDGSGRSSDVVTLLGYVGTAQGLRATTFVGRTGGGGTGGTVNTGNGYYNLPNASGSQVNLIQNIFSTTSSYTNDYIYINAYNSATNASGHGDNGVSINLVVDVSLAAKALSFNESVNVTVTTRVDIVYPETTYLNTSPWGTPTIT
jgi:hypothetical protein